MRKLPAILMLVAGFGALPARAQSAASPAASSPSYETQKANFQAARYASMAELRALGKSGDGRVVELRGQVKGSFSRDNSRVLLFQVAEGENIVIETGDSFKGTKAVLPGATSRFLCRLKWAPDADITLTLIAASDGPDPVLLFKNDDLDAVVAPPSGETLPPPDQITIGDDGAIITTGAPQIRVIAGSAKSSATKNGAFSPTRTGNSLPSRGLPRSAQTQRAANPYFGFDAAQRVAYKNLARRNNPRLSDAAADNIAVAILMAAQSNRLDPRFLAAIVTVESSFDPYCLSSSGAMGLGQLMPFNLRSLGVSNAWDPAQNLSGSARLLRQNLDIYANQSNGTLLAVAAYHAGVGAVNRAGKAVPPRAATQRYVWKVYYAYRALAPELFSR